MSVHPLPILVRVLFYCALYWLVTGLMLAALAGIKLIWPGLLDGSAAMTYGRLAPAVVNMLVYGWAGSAAFGVSYWLLGRLGLIQIGCPAWAGVAAFFWQVGVLIGVLGILGGSGEVVFLLDVPRASTVVLFASGTCLSVYGCSLLVRRQDAPLFASSWYLAAALLAFPWFYGTAALLLVWQIIPGPSQLPVAAWFSSGLGQLWLGGSALACLYYLIPQMLRRRVCCYHLALPAFWLFVALAAWIGLASLVGGPVPVWMAATGSYVGVLMLLPLAVIGLNFFGTLGGAFEVIRSMVVMRLALLAAAAFCIVTMEGALLALPPVSGFFQFTDVVSGQGALFVFGCVTPAFGAVIYHSFGGRGLGGRPWAFWVFAGGVAALYLCLTLGGFLQAVALSDSGFPFMTSVTFVRPFRFMALLALFAILAGILAFLLPGFSAGTGKEDGE